jgi:uncharacterized protein YgiM (DUF1202 family)
LDHPAVVTPVPEVKKEAPVVEVKKEEPKPASQPMTGKVYLKETSFIYREKNEKSQRTWQFVAGTELTLVTRENEWTQVKDSQGRGGWVLNAVVQGTPVEKSVPQVNREVTKATGQGTK